MGLKAALAVMLTVVVITLLLVYYFMPFGELEFSVKEVNYNFTQPGIMESSMQFHNNMRFPEKEISYRILNCSLKKSQDMRDAFDIIENITVLEFSEVPSDEEISVACDEKARVEKRIFIAGEGGPTAIIRSGEYNVILHGAILLLRESSCERPNIAIHELLHVLGFTHSSNKNNVMYNFTSCRQTVGDDIPKVINEIYSVKSLPDLMFENISANTHGRYLDINFSIRNVGLANASNSTVDISLDDKFVKEIEIEELAIGNGRMVSATNIWVKRISVEELNVFIDYPGDELNKENNDLTLGIKE